MDWVQHFEPKGGHQTGTVLGYWTVAELRDYLEAVGFAATKISQFTCSDWLAQDSSGYNQWQDLRVKVLDSFQQAQDNSLSMINYVPKALWSITPAGLAWDELVSVMHNLSGLYVKIQEAGYCSPPSYQGMPQPTNSDLDIEVMQGSGDILAKVKEAGKAVVHAANVTTPWLVLGLGLAGGLLIINYLGLKRA